METAASLQLLVLTAAILSSVELRYKQRLQVVTTPTAPVCHTFSLLGRGLASAPGHALFLRMTGEAGPREELRFLVKAR